MAKKKKETEEPESLDSMIDSVCDKIDKDFGVGTVVGGTEFVNTPKVIIPLSPALDIITGGIQEGTFVGITGNEKTGKTTTALSFAATAQKPEYGSRPIFYFKIEGRLSMKHLREIEGLNLDRPHFNIITSTKGKILSAQEHLTIALDVIKKVPRAVLILDSISALVDEKELIGGVGTETRGGGAKATSQFLAQAAQPVPVNDCIVIGITHLMCNTSGMGSKYLQKATRRWHYQCDYRLRATLGKEWKWKGSKGEQIGLNVTWDCNHTTLGKPGQSIDSHIRFGIGVDKLYEIINFGMQMGLIGGSGWYSFDFVEKRDPSTKLAKVQGMEGLYRKLTENPQWVEWLTHDVMEFLGQSSFASSGDDE